MRILFVHNYYREQGGEDVSFHNEMDLLPGMGTRWKCTPGIIIKFKKDQ